MQSVCLSRFYIDSFLEIQKVQEFLLGAASDGAGEGVALSVHHRVEGL